MEAPVSVVEWLKQGGPWGQAPTIIETHAAIVFLVGDRAYKLKKAVDLGYLDFSTPERRRAVLDRELVLNRRTAPSIYLRVLPIRRDEVGSYSLEGEGTVTDWLLEMRRFPDDALMSQLADRGLLDDATIERLAAHIARYHDEAAVIADYNWPQAIARISRENSIDLRAQKNAFGLSQIESISAKRDAAVRNLANTLAIQSKDVRHCHGDLHLKNAFVEHGEPVLFDCIEFDDFYATIPPLYDLSFLLMDLLDRGLPRLANRALNTWFVHRDQPRWNEIAESLSVLPLYLALRAEIRAKTEALRPGGLADARKYLALAGKCLETAKPRLIAIGGLSGTGKSSLAKDLAWRLGGAAGALHLRTDEIRKRMAGVPLSDRLPPASYTSDASDRVYDCLYHLARLALKSGRTVILDAVFARPAERTQAAKIAFDAGLAFDAFWLNAPASVLERRLSARRNDASDADIDVLRKQALYDLGHIDWHRIDVSGSPAEVSDAVRKQINFSEFD